MKLKRDWSCGAYAQQTQTFIKYYINIENDVSHMQLSSYWKIWFSTVVRIEKQRTSVFFLSFFKKNLNPYCLAQLLTLSMVKSTIEKDHKKLKKKTVKQGSHCCDGFIFSCCRWFSNLDATVPSSGNWENHRRAQRDLGGEASQDRGHQDGKAGTPPTHLFPC